MNGSPAARISLDVDDFALDRMHQRGAPDGAVRTDARDPFRVLDP